MKKTVSIIIFSCITFNHLFSQEIFTNAEVMPSFKGGIQELEDLVKKTVDTYYLGDNDSVICRFTVAKDSSVSNITILETSSSYLENKLKKTITKTSGLWIPASQNRQIVTAFQTIKIIFHDNHLKIEFLGFNTPSFKTECIDNIAFDAYNIEDSVNKNSINFQFTKDSLVITNKQKSSIIFKVLDKKCELILGKGKRQYDLISTQDGKAATLQIISVSNSGKIFLYEKDHKPICFNINLSSYLH